MQDADHEKTGVHARVRQSGGVRHHAILKNDKRQLALHETIKIYDGMEA